MLDEYTEVRKSKLVKPVHKRVIVIAACGTQMGKEGREDMKGLRDSENTRESPFGEGERYLPLR